MFDGRQLHPVPKVFETLTIVRKTGDRPFSARVKFELDI
jgi:hypothetical protein